ncbi:MAG: hypothetical protein OK454_12260, partial [Thaumarchaeota archaeon]|nr:hypothetical protein [Nitrososphaerota archaeon]
MLAKISAIRKWEPAADTCPQCSASAGGTFSGRPMSNLLELALHIDKKLGPIIREHGTSTYLILFG